MKRLLYIFLAISATATVSSCERDGYGNYAGGEPNSIVSILDVRPLYKGKDVLLTKENVYGASKLAAVVISEHAQKNLPEGLLIVQDNRRLATLRGIAVELGAAAANYHPGDSVQIDFSNGTLTRKNGILTITGLTTSNITAKGKGTVALNAITVAQLLATPNDYESSLCIINKSSFNPSLASGETIGGAKKINDGFGDLVLYTDPKVSYAGNAPYALAAYVGIPFTTSDGSVQLRTREATDIVDMGSSAQDLLITGFQSDPKGGDGGYEYVQLLATKDIDFKATPYCIVFNNNAGTASSATPLDAGWATGGQRTVKWNIDSLSVKKGKFFYFGFQGKKINGSGGTFAFPATGINYLQKNYATSGTNPGDGGLVRTSEFGTSGPWANSGNACGVAIFKGKNITEASVPEDVLFVASGGGTAIYDPAKNPILGYRICNNDWYSMYSVVIDQTTYKPIVVPFLHYRSAGNTNNMPYPFNDKYPSGTAADAGLFNMMGGVYNITLGRWTTARKQTVFELIQTTATIDSLEINPNVTKLVE